MRVLFRVVDFETTGIPTEDQRQAICEIGWCDVGILSGVAQDPQLPRSIMVNPGRPMPVEAMAVHHIRDADVADAGSPDAGLRHLMDGMEPQTSVFVAHNADFEREFFAGGDVPWICTYKAALRIWPDAPSHNNQVLRYFLGIDLDPELAMPPHRAGPDAYVTAHILTAILDTGADPEELIRWSNGPALLPKITFGKHKGCRWEDAPLDYLRWIVDRSDLNRDIKANAKHHLKARENVDA